MSESLNEMNNLIEENDIEKQMKKMKKIFESDSKINSIKNEKQKKKKNL